MESSDDYWAFATNRKFAAVARQRQWYRNAKKLTVAAMRFLAALALIVASTMTGAGAQEAGSEAPAPAAPAESASAAVPAQDVKTATNIIRHAWNEYESCRRPSSCKAYFDSFGVAISFADGTIAPFSHTQRLNASPRDCIKNARALLEEGNRSLAVQWVMAARVEDVQKRDWLGNHPEAVLEALRHCCW